MERAWQLLAWGPDGWGDEFARGLILTLQISAVSYLLATVFGLIGAWGLLAPSRFARTLATVYTTVVRSLPELPSRSTLVESANSASTPSCP